MIVYGSATLLVSRQSLYPSRSTPWIAATLEALTWLSRGDYRLVSSINVNSWNCITALASHLDLPLRLIVPSHSSSDYFRKKSWAEEEFELKDKDVNWDSFIVHDMTSGETNIKRDQTVVGLSQMLLPISIRPGGIMDELRAKAKEKRKVIESRFEVPYESRSEKIAYRVETNQLSDEIRRFSEDYLIHWTRTSKSVWPGERQIDYFRAIINSEHYPHRALDTLIRIIESGQLLASAVNMPKKMPTVSFSALTPGEAVPLMRWRSRYHQMSFEPYGIGVRRAAAETVGVKPVLYYDREKSMPDSVEPWLTQSKGSISDWTAEKEYRYRGNLALDKFDESDLILFVRTSDEARFVHEKTGLRTISFLL